MKDGRHLFKFTICPPSIWPNAFSGTVIFHFFSAGINVKRLTQRNDPFIISDIDINTTQRGARFFAVDQRP